MYRRSLILLVVLTLCLAGPGWAKRTQEDYDKTIEIFKNVSGVAHFFDSAYGYVVFPSIGKGGLGIGAAHGKGQVWAGGKVTGYSNLTDVSIGLQAGGQAYRQVIFFQDRRAYEEFTEEGTVRIAAAPLPAGGVEVRVSDTGPGIPSDQLDTR